ncbi:hypothetical protein [Pacificoceanicola onchidii]|uniref:hypothetical protein n=1 Tax=Pacificoceanicola onchidii TaxID=2562685 RepID=UPI0010A54204|nr:hypothetical protein [Pacificoceanicola onchidii]
MTRATPDSVIAALDLTDPPQRHAADMIRHLAAKRSDQRGFYMICRKPTHQGSKTEPKARIAHFNTARDDARRLARSAGAPFVVLGVVDVVNPTDDLTGRLL